MPIHGLEHSVERLENASELFLQLFVAYGLEQRLVVFIYEDGNAVSGLLVRPSDDAGKAQ